MVRAFCCRERFLASCQCCLHAHRSMHNQAGKCAFSSGRSPFMKTHLTKGLLQIIVGPWQVRDLIAEKEMWTIVLAFVPMGACRCKDGDRK